MITYHQAKDSAINHGQARISSHDSKIKPRLNEFEIAMSVNWI